MKQQPFKLCVARRVHSTRDLAGMSRMSYTKADGDDEADHYRGYKYSSRLVHLPLRQNGSSKRMVRGIIQNGRTITANGILFARIARQSGVTQFELRV